jgi:hypothetical protein
LSCSGNRKGCPCGQPFLLRDWQHSPVISRSVQSASLPWFKRRPLPRSQSLRATGPRWPVTFLGVCVSQPISKSKLADACRVTGPLAGGPTPSHTRQGLLSGLVQNLNHAGKLKLAPTGHFSPSPRQGEFFLPGKSSVFPVGPNLAQRGIPLLQGAAASWFVCCESC